VARSPSNRGTQSLLLPVRALPGLPGLSSLPYEIGHQLFLDAELSCLRLPIAAQLFTALLPKITLDSLLHDIIWAALLGLSRLPQLN
jgi:hypothetical protein